MYSNHIGSTIIYYKEVNYKYTLVRDFVYEIPIRINVPIVVDFIELCGNWLRLKEGYSWDGPSGPTWDSKCSMRAALVHDGLYQLMREGYLDHKYRKVADKVFYQILKKDGMNWLRRLLWWRAVRRFAAYAIQPRDNSVKVAP